VTFFKKGVKKSDKCEIFYALKNGPCSVEILDSILSLNKEYAKHQKISNSKLYDGDELYIRVSADGNESVSSILEKMCTYNKCFNEYYRINNGVHSQADYLSPKKFDMRDNKSKEIGDGIYVLDQKNKEDLKVLKDIRSSSEKSYLFPFFKNSDVTFFGANEKTSKWLIYINKKHDNLNKLPVIKKHLNGFKTIIDKASDNAPYLHRAKTKEDFTSEKVIVSQRNKFNKFGYTTKNWFASADVYFITEDDNSLYSLKSITSILNSKAYYVWFYFKGKRKGETLELYKTPIGEAPLPKLSKAQEKKLEGYFTKLNKKYSSVIFDEMNEYIYEIYNFEKKEIKFINDFYEKQVVENISEDDLKEAA
jgi:adenine-specific DNA-methyltransferase